MIELGRFDNLTLGEIQLLQLGLWVIGERNQVDEKQVADYSRLLRQLGSAAAAKVRIELDKLDK